MSGYFLPGGTDLVWIYLLRRSTAEKGVLADPGARLHPHTLTHPPPRPLSVPRRPTEVAR